MTKTISETRSKLSFHGMSTSGFNYEENWMFRGREMRRYHTLPSYPWEYTWQDARLPNGSGSPMSQEEISAFKKAKEVN